MFERGRRDERRIVARYAVRSCFCGCFVVADRRRFRTERKPVGVRRGRVSVVVRRDKLPAFIESYNRFFERIFRREKDDRRIRRVVCFMRLHFVYRIARSRKIRRYAFFIGFKFKRNLFKNRRCYNVFFDYHNSCRVGLFSLRACKRKDERFTENRNHARLCYAFEIRFFEFRRNRLSRFRNFRRGVFYRSLRFVRVQRFSHVRLFVRRKCFARN